MIPKTIESTHEIHRRHEVVLYYGNGKTERETFYGDEPTAYDYAEKLKIERKAQSVIVDG